MAEEIICQKCGAPNPRDTVFCGKCGDKMAEPVAEGEVQDQLVGKFIGERFLVHEKLGEGGMGVVYRAEQTAVQRQVAIKVLHLNLTQDEGLHARFQNEAAASSRLNHPNTITLYDFGKTDVGSLYIAMEYIKGINLDDEITNNGAIDWKRACQIGIQMCGSLQDAHENGIVHRDMKPENVMLVERGGDPDFVKVLDFGIAKIVEDDGTDQRKALTKTGMVFGTPQYMSPEQIRGEKASASTDIYSIGVILYQALTGRLPFLADMPMGVLTKHLMDVPPPFLEANPDVSIPQEFEEVVMAALGKEIGDRPASMKQLGEMLTNVLNSSSSTTVMTPLVNKGGSGETPTPQKNVASGKSSKAGMIAGVIVVALVVLIGGGTLGWHFLKGSGVDEKKPSLPVAPAVTQPAVPVAPPVAPPGPAQVGAPTVPTPAAPAIADGTQGVGGAKPLPSTPQIDDSSTDNGKGSNSKGSTGSSKARGTACVFKSADDPVARAMKKMLKSKESKIKKCASNNSVDKTVVSFKVAAKGKKATGLKSSGSDSFAGCVKSLVGGEFKISEEVGSRKGNVAFGVTKQGGVVRMCAVAVEAKAKKSGLFTPPIIIGGKKATDDKKVESEKKKKKKKSGKPRQVTIPSGIKIRKNK